MTLDSSLLVTFVKDFLCVDQVEFVNLLLICTIMLICLRCSCCSASHQILIESIILLIWLGHCSLKSRHFTDSACCWESMSATSSNLSIALVDSWLECILRSHFDGIVLPYLTVLLLHHETFESSPNPNPTAAYSILLRYSSRVYCRGRGAIDRSWVV